MFNEETKLHAFTKVVICFSIFLKRLQSVKFFLENYDANIQLRFIKKTKDVIFIVYYFCED